jgi:hypothetical protein
MAANPSSPSEAGHPVAVAFSFHVSRNLLIQAAVIAMTAIAGLAILPWPVALGWSVAVLITAVLVRARPAGADDDALRHRDPHPRALWRA